MQATNHRLNAWLRSIVDSLKCISKDVFRIVFLYESYCILNQFSLMSAGTAFWVTWCPNALKVTSVLPEPVSTGLHVHPEPTTMKLVWVISVNVVPAKGAGTATCLDWRSRQDSVTRGTTASMDWIGLDRRDLITWQLSVEIVLYLVRGLSCGRMPTLVLNSFLKKSPKIY